jgi:hypothetical protein
VSTGEFVVNAQATSRHRGMLDAINSNRLPGFASGGVVPPSPAPLNVLSRMQAPAPSDGGGNHVSVNVINQADGTKVETS